MEGPQLRLGFGFFQFFSYVFQWRLMGKLLQNKMKEIEVKDEMALSEEGSSALLHHLSVSLKYGRIRNLK